MKLKMISLILVILVAEVLLNFDSSHEQNDLQYLDNDGSNIEWMNKQLNEIWDKQITDETRG